MFFKESKNTKLYETSFVLIYVFINFALPKILNAILIMDFLNMILE